MNRDEELTPPAAIHKIVAFFQGKNIKGNLKFEAEMMLSDVLNCERLDIYLKYDILLNGQEKEKLRTYIRKRVQGIPLAYILGTSYFYGKKILCHPGVLIPRPDTEDLVLHTLEIIREYRQITGKDELNMLELGCGTGAVSLAIASEEKRLHFRLTDVSQTALENTRINVKAFETVIGKGEHTFEVSHLDILSATPGELPWDIIISNPPYVSVDEYNCLAEDSVQYEPSEAFIGGKDGLDFYRCFASKLHDNLCQNGYLIFECGYTQKNAIHQIFNDSQHWKLYKMYRDINKKDRGMVFQPKNGTGNTP